MFKIVGETVFFFFFFLVGVNVFGDGDGDVVLGLASPSPFLGLLVGVRRYLEEVEDVKVEVPYTHAYHPK